MNTTKPESTLKKKHNVIAYHRVREAQAAGVIRIAKEDSETNLADVLTKSLPGPRLLTMMNFILWKGDQNGISLLQADVVNIHHRPWTYAMLRNHRYKIADDQPASAGNG